MLKIQLFTIGLLVSFTTIPMTNAQSLAFGEVDDQYGKLTVSGFLRAKLQDKSWSDNDHKILFDVVRLNLDYEKDKFFSHIEYRCYQYDQLCDFSSLVDAYIGYHLNKQDHFKLGVQTLSFGPGRFWESNYYGGINTQYGLEDIHNLGLNYHVNPLPNISLDVGFFPTDAGHYRGESKDAGRYSANFVKPNDPDHIQLEEENMWVGRIQHDLQLLQNDKISTSLGASYWASDIKNKTSNQKGSRQAWSVFGSVSYDDLNISLVAGQNKIVNKDPLNEKISLMGSFDDNYWVANKGDFYTFDVSYKFKEALGMDLITTYAMHSSYIKDAEGFNDSARNLIGVSMDKRNHTFVAEYIMGKNDFLIGGDASSYAEASSSNHEQLLNLQYLYHF